MITIKKVCAFMLMFFSIQAFSQDPKIKEKLKEFFFDLSFDVDIDVIRVELNSNTEFKLYQDPNRDSKKTIIGTFKTDKNLNPICAGNQVIIQYSSSEPKKVKKVSFKWSMNYRLEDLPHAFVDFEKLKSEFIPLFKNPVEVIRTGEQKEKIHSITLKDNFLTVVITLIQYINFSHSVSLEYKDKWRIEPIQIMKVKY